MCSLCCVSNKNQIVTAFFCVKKSKFGMKKDRGGLPGGQVNVLTVYPQHSAIMAAGCHSHISSWGSFTSVSLPCFLPLFVIFSLFLHPRLIFFSGAYTSHRFLSSHSLFPLSPSCFYETGVRKRAGSCYAVCLPPHRDPLLCFWVPKEAELSNIP